MNNFLFKHIDNSALIVFRIIFGLLCFLESAGAIFTGWVKRTLIDPEFTFSFIGFEWLQPLPGNWMYAYYFIMSVFALLIMIGYKYRISAFMFAIMWTATYLMQKSSYNNHYYLLVLLSSIMIFLPANKYASLDANQNPSIQSHSMPKWCSYILILQMFIVYSYGSIAKLYPDWLDTTVIELLMKGKQNYFLIGNLLQYKSVHYLLTYGGIAFDGLIIPLLLFKPTRKLAFFASIFFHLFNSIVFQVGVFPYLSLAFILFFFEPKTIQKIFLKKKSFYIKNKVNVPNYRKPLLLIIAIYFVIQIALPLRHWIIKDDVLWTEEGHRLSWRMMLRSKTGNIQFNVIDTKNNTKIPIKLNSYLSKKQMRSVATKPDVIWQFAQLLKKQYANNGQNISVYAICHISVNGKPFKQLIDPKTDLANVEWNAFKHSSWILPSNQD